MEIVTLRAGLLCAAVFASPAWGQWFAGAIAGLATLSADGASQTGTASAAVSAYKPQNGAAVNIFAGRDVAEYVSIQGNYIWNRNALSLTSVHVDSGQSAYEDRRGSSQQSAVADVLVYFRNRQSRLRPYLSAGLGIVHLSSERKALTAAFGGATPPPARFSADKPALRVAVGIDLVAANRLVFRYSFSETNSGNPISAQLSPPGQRVLKNFQNLFGFVYRL